MRSAWSRHRVLDPRGCSLCAGAAAASRCPLLWVRGCPLRRARGRMVATPPALADGECEVRGMALAPPLRISRCDWWWSALGARSPIEADQGSATRACASYREWRSVGHRILCRALRRTSGTCRRRARGEATPASGKTCPHMRIGKVCLRARVAWRCTRARARGRGSRVGLWSLCVMVRKLLRKYQVKLRLSPTALSSIVYNLYSLSFFFYFYLLVTVQP